MDFEDIIELLGYFFRYIGASFLWLICFGKKPFKTLLDMKIISGILGFIISVATIILCKTYILELILSLIKN